MYPFLNARHLMSMYRPVQLQLFQPPPEHRQGQSQPGGGGGLNPQFLKQWLSQPNGGGLNAMKDWFGQGAGGPGAAAGGEAAPLGLVGDYSGAAAAMPAAGAGAAPATAGPAAALGEVGGLGLAGEGLGAAGAGEGIGAGLGEIGAGVGEGIGAGLGELGAGLGEIGAGIGEGLMALFAMFSDPRLKEDKAVVGELYDGTPVWSYSLFGHLPTQIGLMAPDVAQRYPDAVHDVGGVSTVDYGRATEKSRAIAREDGRKRPMGILNLGEK
jgi:hypothetical protein